MNNFSFHSPTEFVFGKDTENKTALLCRKYGATKVLIVYGGGSVVRSGLLQRVEQVLQEAAIPYVELGGVQPNPTDPKVYEGIDIWSPGVRRYAAGRRWRVGYRHGQGYCGGCALSRRFLGFLCR